MTATKITGPDDVPDEVRKMIAAQALREVAATFVLNAETSSSVRFRPGEVALRLHSHADRLEGVVDKREARLRGRR